MEDRAPATRGLSRWARPLRRLGRKLGLGRRTADRKPAGGFTALAELQRLYDGPAPGPPVLYFGDSVLERTSRDDTDQRTLAEMVVAGLGGAGACAALSHSAYHPGVFAALLRALGRMRHGPELVVLPVNVRCFSPQWDFHPEFQFAAELACLEAFVAGKPLPAVPAGDHQPTREELSAYEAIRVAYPSIELSTIGEFRRVVATRPSAPDEIARRLAVLFKYHYTHQLVPDHRKLVKLRECCELVTARSRRCLVYVTPVNHEAGRRHAGDTFAAEYGASVAVLREALRPYEAAGRLAVEDLSFALGSTEFVQPEIANEHLNQAGRRELAAAVVGYVQRLRNAAISSAE